MVNQLVLCLNFDKGKKIMASTYYKLDILERSETGSKGSKVAERMV